MDFTLYWFMFPLAILVATTAMLSGIGGTALFMPIFLLIFPVLGPAYTLDQAVTAIAAALLTSTFGFASGFIGYYRRGLIDFRQGGSFLVFSLPAVITGALMSHWIDPTYIRLTYGLMMFGLVWILLFGFPLKTRTRRDLSAPEISRRLLSRSGKTYQYLLYRPQRIPTLLGGFLTGLLSVGIGETVMPQMIKDGKIPVPVAAASSVLAVIGTMLVASTTHVITLVRLDGFEAVPWHLVCYTIPGVIIGGQLGPKLQGRIPAKTMVRVIAMVFTAIGVAMLTTVYVAWFSP